MLTDTALKSLKPKDKPYKVTDRDGFHVFITPRQNLILLRFRLSGRRETLTIGRYDHRIEQPTLNHNGIDYGMSATLAEA